MSARQSSKTLWKIAQKVMPGGVNSPVRAFKAVGGEPVFMKEGRGAVIVDENGRRYIDYMGSWGPLILGHAHPEVARAIARQARKGTSFGAVTALEVELASLICNAFGHVEKVRLVSSGTEAVMSAIRLARAATGRNLIVKMDGGYHGHCDAMLVKAGSGATTFGYPDSAGITKKTASETRILPFNDKAAAEAIFSEQGDKIAALITEPVLGNMGLIPPQPGYLETLRRLCTRHGALLIFDEVITGFRLCLGGAGKRLGVTPDITVLGKIIGGGLPLAAFGGPARIMDLLAPLGPVYQAGTLSGNPVATRCGIQTLKILARPGTHEKIDRAAGRLESGIKEALGREGIAHQWHRMGSMFTLFFAHEAVTDAASARKADTQKYRRWFHALLKRGVYFPPSAFETCFVSLAHGNKEIDRTIRVFDQAAQEIA